jgi:hypothetical protein
VDGADIGVIEGGGGLRFALKPREGLRVFRDGVWEKFQGHEAMKASVFGFVNNAHASATEFFENAVVRDDSAEQGVGIRHWWLILSLVGAQVNARVNAK